MDSIMKTNEEKRYPIRGSTGIKLVAFLLFLVMGLSAVGCMFTIMLYAEDGSFGSYYPAENFYESALCNMATNYNLRQLSQDVQFSSNLEGLLENKNVPYYAENSNLLFVAKYYESWDEMDAGAEPYKIIQSCNGDRVSTVTYTHYYYAYNEPRSDSHYLQSIYDDYAAVELTLYLRSPLIDNGDGFVTALKFYNFMQGREGLVIFLFVLSILAALALLVFLFIAAGRKKGRDEIRLCWFDKIPLDLLFILSGILVGFSIAAAVQLSFSLYQSGLFGFLFSLELLSCALAVSLTLLFFLSLTARIKAGKWWRNTLVYIWLWRLVRWCWKWVRKIASAIWRGIKRIFGGIKRGIAKLLLALPMTWRAVAVFCVLELVNIILSAVLFPWFNGFLFFLFIVYQLSLVLLIIYICYQMRILQRAGRELASGNLSYKTETSRMIFDFKEHGENLNSISEGMSRAVEERLKSEQFKSELITNVSHDIKTPLTSIINYVDLLKKEDIEGEKANEYIEVLDRQSARLKKLTEDLVEASKVTSGVIATSYSENDVSELLRQALGEYKSRLEAADINVIVNEPEEPVNIICDGKLMWRVFDNLLGNICKYAHPGTRAFVDIENEKREVWIVFKNTSREVLNISAEQLMERFVRGDRSRSSDGSGLGLSIARSLVELQGGSFSLHLDGDLFKVIMTLPRENEKNTDLTLI